MGMKADTKMSAMLPWLRTAVVASRMASEMSRPGVRVRWVRSEMSGPPPMPRENVCSRVSSSLCAEMATHAAAPGRAHTALSMPHLPRSGLGLVCRTCPWPWPLGVRGTTAELRPAAHTDTASGAPTSLLWHPYGSPMAALWQPYGTLTAPLQRPAPDSPEEAASVRDEQHVQCVDHRALARVQSGACKR
eukprot:scaffold89211_cov54-Phaeocystis_antarctica.AAC.3